jgi:hypothetical protein
MRRPAALLALAAIALLVSSVVAPRPARAGLLTVSVAVNDTYSVRHDRMLSVPQPGVLGNDVDVDLLGKTTVQPYGAGVSHGTLTLAADGGFSYLPEDGYVGRDTFEYKLPGLLTTPATVTINVTNAPPVARPDTYTITPGRTLTVGAPGVLANDSDPDGDRLSAGVTSGISGSLKLNPDGSFTYTPNGGFEGSDSFTYRIWDGVTWSGSTTVTLTEASSTPAPTSTPRPTATPTPTPHPIALPTLPLPTALPTIAIPSLPLPTIGPSSSPIPTLGPSSGTTPSGAPVTSVPSASEKPSASPSQQASSGNGASPGDGPGGSTRGGGASAPIAAATDGTGESRLAIKTVADGQESQLAVPLLGTLQVGQLWWVPAATIGGPGLLVILWVALQLLAGIAWLPVTRRFRRQEPPAAWTLVSTQPNR